MNVITKRIYVLHQNILIFKRGFGNERRVYLLFMLVVCLFANTRRSMGNSKITEDQKKIARYAKAMSHPIRMYVLELLISQTCCYSGDLSENLPIARSTLSQHLKELKEAGLIQGEIEAPKIKYCINKENWREAQTLFKKFLST